MGEHNPELRDFLALVRPNLKGRRKGGTLLMRLVNMGMLFNEDGQPDAVGLKSQSSWKNWGNGSSRMNPDIAGEVAGRWDSDKFSEQLYVDYSEDAVNALVGPMSRLLPTVNKGNVAFELGEYLLKIFRRIAGLEVELDTPVTVAEALRASGRPYYDSGQNKIRLGDYAVKAGRRVSVPDEIQHQEQTYVTALVDAYCYGLGSEIPRSVDMIPDRYKQHFGDQRKAFFSAEWLKETTWDSLIGSDGKNIFDEFLDEIHQGIADVLIDDHPNPVKRLIETLKQATAVQLDSITLGQVANLIDALCRKGACHELVTLKRVSWEDVL